MITYSNFLNMVRALHIVIIIISILGINIPGKKYWTRKSGSFFNSKQGQRLISREVVLHGS